MVVSSQALGAMSRGSWAMRSANCCEEFTPRDFKAIIDIGIGSKRDDPSRIGKFGRGALTMFGSRIKDYGHDANISLGIIGLRHLVSSPGVIM
jgi:hypothetical protein